MKLSHQELQRLKAAGFDEQQIEHVESAKDNAGLGGANWSQIFQKLVEHGPEILAFAKVLAGLLGKS